MARTKKGLSARQQLIKWVLFWIVVSITATTILMPIVSLQHKKQEQQNIEAEQEKLRLERLHDDEVHSHQLDIENTKRDAALSEEHQAELSEHARRESEALKTWHNKFPEDQPILLPLSFVFADSDQVGAMVTLRKDNVIALTRRPALPETEHSEYEFQWSSGAINLEEVVSFDTVGRPIIKLVARRDDSKAPRPGWNNVQIDIDSMAFEGDYICEIGDDGISTEDITYRPYFDLNYKVMITKIRANSPGAEAGLQEGDLILKINNVDQVGKGSGEIVRQTLVAPGSELLFTVFRQQVEVHNITRVAVPNSDSGSLGIAITWSKPYCGYIDSVYSNSPVLGEEIHAGDRVTSLNGDDVQQLSPGEIAERLAGPAGRSIPIGFERVRYVKVRYSSTNNYKEHLKSALPSLQAVRPPDWRWPSSEQIVTRAPDGNVPSPIPQSDKTAVASRNVTAEPFPSPSASSGANSPDIYLEKAKKVILAYFASRDSSSAGSSVGFFDPGGVFYYGGYGKTPAQVQERIDAQNAQFPYRNFKNTQVLRVTPKPDFIYDAYVESDVTLAKSRYDTSGSQPGHFYIRVKCYSNGVYITHLNDSSLPGWQLAHYRAWISDRDHQRSDGTDFSTLPFDSKEIEAREIIFQDRVNYAHGNRDPQDEDSGFFHTDTGKLGKVLDGLRALPINVIGDVNKIIAGGVLVEVKVFKESQIEITVIQ